MAESAPRIEVIYDGQCPFCSSYVRMVRLRAEAGRVDLVDARSADTRVAEMRRAGFDLDAGMVVRHGGQVFHGEAAMRHLSVLSAPGGLFNDLMRRIFRSPRRAAALYPVLARGRRLTLRLLGRRPLKDPGRDAGE
ncbi:DCC1-like thiol-disulfide oxidoreductase family protein [Paracoccaceae bacterium Fryx2]|nr:DCC1-like thiol-disulfide oxidoreductase family protein [Paracoccaceae bacterium Fryx2]